MPAAPLPPMTSRQAKRAGKKSAGQFRYTASQMRRADRREELEERKKKEEEKERKKKASKRKRDEEEEKERNKKRRLLNEGKIAIEDTWGKVNASQPRLNMFFVGSGGLQRRNSEPVRTSQTKRQGKLSKSLSSDLRRESTSGVVESKPIMRTAGEEISDCDLLSLIPSQNSLDQKSPPTSHNSPKQCCRISPSISKQSELSSNLEKHTQEAKEPNYRTQTTTKLSKRSQNSCSSSQPKFAEMDVNVHDGTDEIKIAEDDTAETEACLALAQDLSDSFASNRSALSEMTVGQVNVRATEKPDTTSLPDADVGLFTPSKQTELALNRNEKVAFSKCTEELDTDDDDQTWDKENSDPVYTPVQKAKASERLHSASNTPSRKAPKSILKTSAVGTPKLAHFDDSSDYFDIDFETGIDDDFSDEDLDDAEFAAIAATQKPGSSKVVDLRGSPRRLTPRRDALVKPIPLTFTPRPSMLPPPPKTASARLQSNTTKCNPSKLVNKSLSFSSINDDDLLDFAEQVEEELSQKSTKSKGKAPAYPDLQASRHSLPPMSTQALMLQMVDDDDEPDDI